MALPRRGRASFAAAVAVALGCTGAATARAQTDADALVRQARSCFDRRARSGEAVKSVELYGRAIAAGGSYAALWEGARAAFYYGYFALPKRARSERLAVLKRGAGWAERATEIRPAGAEGHFYHASLLGGWGEIKGLAGAMIVAGEIRRSAEKALALNRGVECAGPLRLLGRYYFKLPGAFGGSTKRSLAYLEEALRRCPTHPQAHLYLADTLRAVGERDRARERAQWVLDHPSPGLEYRQFRADAEALLDRL